LTELSGVGGRQRLIGDDAVIVPSEGREFYLRKAQELLLTKMLYPQNKSKTSFAIADFELQKIELGCGKM